MAEIDWTKAMNPWEAEDDQSGASVPTSRNPAVSLQIFRASRHFCAKIRVSILELGCAGGFSVHLEE
jgi:hypothetical protein